MSMDNHNSIRNIKTPLNKQIQTLGILSEFHFSSGTSDDTYTFECIEPSAYLKDNDVYV